MHKHILKGFCGIFCLLILLTQNFPIFSQDIGSTALRECWELNLEGINKSELASDNSQVFFSYSNGIVSAVDSKTGNQNWKTELGGETNEISSDNGNLFVISLSGSEGSNQIITIRQLSSDTGIVKWQKNLEITKTENAEDSLLINGEYLFFISGSGVIYKISKKDGQEIEKTNLEQTATTQAKIIDDNLYIGTKEANLNIYSISNKSLKKISLKEVPTTLFADGDKIIIGDRLGKITALKTTDNTKEWQTRTGAEISNIIKTERGLAVSSNDNFIYLLSQKNGAKLWKKRLAGRTAATSNDTENIILAVNLNSDVSTLIETEKGKTINQISLRNSNFFINKPILINKRIIFHTNTGIIAYASTAENCREKEKPKA